MAHVGPPSRALEWARDQLGGSAQISAVLPLRSSPGDRGPWTLAVHGGDVDAAVLKTAPTGSTASRGTTTPIAPEVALRREAASLRLAEAAGLAVPHLLSAHLSGENGWLALLMTQVEGASRPADDGALRAVGAAIAQLEGIVVPPGLTFPSVTRARQGDDYVAHRKAQRDSISKYQRSSEAGRSELLASIAQAHSAWNARRVVRYVSSPETTPLITAAERLISDVHPQPGDRCLVHDDIAPGNIVWRSDGAVVLLDWEGAGTGPVTLDLGNARFEMALNLGLRAADLVLDGWSHVTGVAAPPDLAYWDVAAALNTPAKMFGWTDLADAEVRRDAFLHDAVGRLANADPPGR